MNMHSVNVLLRLLSASSVSYWKLQISMIWQHLGRFLPAASRALQRAGI